MNVPSIVPSSSPQPHPLKKIKQPDALLAVANEHVSMHVSLLFLKPGAFHPREAPLPHKE